MLTKLKYNQATRNIRPIAFRAPNSLCNEPKNLKFVYIAKSAFRKVLKFNAP